MVLLILSIALALAGCSTNSPQQAQTIEGGAVYDAEMKDGVQEAILSWGRFNYAPEIIKLKLGVPAKIIADTKRLTGCYRVMKVPELNLEKHFSEKDNVLEFTPAKSGTFPFACAMGMGRGTLVVE